MNNFIQNIIITMIILGATIIVVNGLDLNSIDSVFAGYFVGVLVTWMSYSNRKEDK